MSLEINLAYIDSSEQVRNRPPPAPPPKEKEANLLESANFDRQKWLSEQERLSAMMTSMYQ